MANPVSGPKNEKPRNIDEQEFNDLVYSIETKTFLHFMKPFITNDIFPATTAINDPLPQFDFDTVSGEIIKRLPGMGKYKLEDTKTWLKGPVKKLDDLQNGRYGVAGETMAEIKEYKTKLETIITAIENILTKGNEEKQIQQTTHDQFGHLDVLNDKDNGNT